MEKVILVWGYYGYGNLGDELALQALKRLVPTEHMLVTSVDPDLTWTQLGLRSVYSHCLLDHRRNMTERARLFRAVSKADCLVFGGGTFLHDQGHYRVVLMQFLWLLGMLIVAKASGTKVFALSIGLGPLKTRTGRWLTKVFLTLTDQILFRDPFSLDLALNLSGRFAHKSALGVDLVFFLDGATTDRGKSHQRKFDGAVIGLNLISHYDYLGEGVRKREQMVQVFSDFCDELIRRYQANIRFIPFQTKVANDSAIGWEVQKRMAEPERFTIVSSITPQNVFQHFGQVDYFVGMRLHSIVLAHILHIPYIAIAYSDKITYFTKDVGQSDALMLMADVTVESLLEKIDSIMCHGLSSNYVDLSERKARTEAWVAHHISGRS